MGAEHSQQTAQASPRKTETANFDFRYESQTFERDYRQTFAGGNITSSGGKESEKNYYWSEVGMDVVKKMEDRKI